MLRNIIPRNRKRKFAAARAAAAVAARDADATTADANVTSAALEEDAAISRTYVRCHSQIEAIRKESEALPAHVRTRCVAVVCGAVTNFF